MNLIPNSTLSVVNCIAKGTVDIEQQRVVEVLNNLHKVNNSAYFFFVFALHNDIYCIK